MSFLFGAWQHSITFFNSKLLIDLLYTADQSKNFTNMGSTPSASPSFVKISTKWTTQRLVYILDAFWKQRKESPILMLSNLTTKGCKQYIEH